MPPDDTSQEKTGANALCRLDEIPDGRARGFRVQGRDGEHRVFVVRRGETLYGYRNDCPHVGTPLDWVPDEFLDRAGEHIICATHGALFRVEDGTCLAGPCVGDQLDPVFVEVRGGVIYVRSESLEDP